MANLHRMYRAIAEGRMDDAKAAFANDALIRQRYEGLENGKWRTHDEPDAYQLHRLAAARGRCDARCRQLEA